MAFSQTGIFNIDGGNLIQRFDYDGDGKVIYQAWAQAGSSTAALVWRIKQLNYSGNNLVSILFPTGSPAFAFSWDNRPNYAYS